MNPNNNNELETMREQLQALKQKIDSQDIVNERLLRSTLKGKNAFGSGYGKMAIFLLVPLAIIIWIFCRYMVGFSWPLVIVIILGCVLDAALDFHLTNHLIPRALNGDLVSAARQMKDINSFIKKQYIVGLTLVLGVMVWAFCESLTINEGFLWRITGDSQSLRYGLCAGLVMGTIIGGISSLYIFKKITRNNSEIVELIESIQQ